MQIEQNLLMPLSIKIAHPYYLMVKLVIVLKLLALELASSDLPMGNHIRGRCSGTSLRVWGSMCGWMVAYMRVSGDGG